MEEHLGVAPSALQDEYLEKKQSIVENVNEEVQEIVPGWPLLSTSCLFFIEFCERFSLLGIRLILSKYLSASLGLTNELYILSFTQLFTFLTLGSSIIGAIVSDLFVGKFWTIFWTLCAIFVTELTLIIPMFFFPTGHPSFPYAELCGILLLAICGGSLKPSLAAMGADQFFHIPFNYLEISCFFAIFYFMGSTANLSAVFTFPAMLMLPCFGYDSCILLIFAIPAALIFICAILLACTICLYDRPFGPPVGMYLIYRSVGTIQKAFANRKARITEASARPPPIHWLDYFLDDHNCYNDTLCQDKRRYATIDDTGENQCAQVEFLDQIKALIRVSTMLLLTPTFFIFYEQCADLWKRQALCLDPVTAFGLNILPAHMPLVHLVLLLLGIPIFQIIIYPLWFRCCCCFPTYLKRMGVGALLLAFAFSSSAVLQYLVDMTQPPQPTQDEVFIKVVNHFPAECSVTITDIGPLTLNVPSREVVPLSIASDDFVQLEGPMDRTNFVRIQPLFTYSAHADCFKHKVIRYKMDALAGHVNYIFLTPHGMFSRSLKYEKPTNGVGEASVSVNLALPCKTITEMKLSNALCSNLTTDMQKMLTVPLQHPIILCHDTGNSSCDTNDQQNIFWTNEESEMAPESLLAFPPVGDKTGKGSLVAYPPKTLQPGKYRLHLADAIVGPLAQNATAPTFSGLTPVGDAFDVRGVGGIYVLSITLNESILLNTTKPKPILYLETIAPPNMLSIQWQLFQYILIIFAEILFCVTGMEFAYVEAPVVLKSLLVSFWFMAVAFGNLTSFFFKFAFTFNRLVDNLFFNATAMFVYAAVFALLSYAYYVYFNFSLPASDDGVASRRVNNHDDGSESLGMISASGAVPVLDDVKRASLRVARI